MTEFAKTTGEVAALWEDNAETWTRLSRAGHDVYRDRHNTPAFLAMLPDVDGQTGLDIGCGEGTNTRHLADRGARMVAIDVSPTFVRHAKEAEAADPKGISYRVADATSLPFSDGQFDFATSFMCMMDVANQDRAVAEAHRVVRKGGFFQFSILHPCFAPPARKTLRNADRKVYAVELSDYFVENDGSVEEWTFGNAKRAGEHIPAPFKVPRFHRTLSNWINLLIGTGFEIEEIAEPTASKQEAEMWPDIADTRVVPLFLHVRGRRN